MSNLPRHEVRIVDTPRTWQQGWDEIERGFDGSWWNRIPKMVYLELYRSLTHGHGLSPDDALATLGASYHAAKSELGA